MTEFFAEFLRSGTLISLAPGHLLIGWGRRVWSSKPTLDSKPCFYFPDFFLTNERSWFVHEQWAEIEQQGLLSKLPKQTSSRYVQWKSPYQEIFDGEFLKLQKLFSAQKLHKAVPYIFEVTKEIINKEHSLHEILSIPQNKYIYGFWDEDEGILGVTPELLFQVDNTDPYHVHTMACAGTQKNQAKIDLAKDPKMLQEHQLVIDGISESTTHLGQLSIGTTSLLELPTLSHLVTPIEIELKKPFNFNDMVQALHPTPALGAYPKITGWEWLTRYEQQIKRRRYGAPVGFQYKNQSACYVSIRNVQWDAEGSMIGAGCGVISSSTKEIEWQEIQLKLRAIKQGMAL